jgi:hypothetical protein
VSRRPLHPFPVAVLCHEQKKPAREAALVVAYRDGFRDDEPYAGRDSEDKFRFCGRNLAY